MKCEGRFSHRITLLSWHNIIMMMISPQTGLSKSRAQDKVKSQRKLWPMEKNFLSQIIICFAFLPLSPSLSFTEQDVRQTECSFLGRDLLLILFLFLRAVYRVWTMLVVNGVGTGFVLRYLFARKTSYHSYFRNILDDSTRNVSYILNKLDAQSLLNYPKSLAENHSLSNLEWMIELAEKSPFKDSQPK